MRHARKWVLVFRISIFISKSHLFIDQYHLQTYNAIVSKCLQEGETP